jgi:VWFA-related protein
LSIKVSVNSVVLNASVRDRRSNRSINGLQLDNFEVYEDGTLQELQQMSITDAPFNLLLLMDVSGSTYSYMKLMKKAASDFLYELGENDRVAIASFNSKVRLLQDFTADPEAAAKVISRLHSAGGTAFYDALMTSVDQYMRGIKGRKAIVVFTDGVDNVLSGDPKEGSFTSFEELYSRLQETDSLIYTIFLNTKGREMNPASSRPQKKQGPFPFPMPQPGATSRFPLPFPIPSPQPFPKSITKQPREKADADSNVYLRPHASNSRQLPI